MISCEYLDIQRQMHKDRPDYGANGHRYAGMVMELCRKLATKEVLDFGCGKGTLGRNLRINGYDARDYDPAIEGKDAPPEPADLVYCGDVAEHVEPEFLDAFLDNLARLAKKSLLLVVATRPAVKHLPDGRNAHLIQEPLEWWLPKLNSRFRMVSVVATPGEFTYLGDSK